MRVSGKSNHNPEHHAVGRDGAIIVRLARAGGRAFDVRVASTAQIANFLLPLAAASNSTQIILGDIIGP
jgi:hypothetical protein